MKLSIVITTFNRAPVLKALLESLAEQSDPDFEVVVAIDGSTDDTEQMLEDLRTPYPLKWVNTHCKGYGLAVARNMGILAATGDLVAIIDDDCFPVRDFVAAHKQSARRRTITGGLRTPGDASDVKQAWKMRELARLPSCEPIAFDQLRRSWPKAVTTECNICLYREDLVEVGLFSERLKMYGFIGQEFFARADHFGYKYQYNPRAEIIHRRQGDGDNGLNQRKKTREIMIALALRPSFTNAAQYAIQVAWARRQAEEYPKRSQLPAFPAGAWAVFPYRFLRNRLGNLRRRLRDARARAA